jgi:ankyrin repeat protein
LASSEGHDEIVMFLLAQRNIEINIQNSEGNSALHIAVHKIHIDVVRTLLSRRDVIRLNLRNNSNETPLHLVCEREYNHSRNLSTNRKREDNKAIATLLVNQQGIELNPKDKDGITPFLRASVAHDEDVLEVLLHQTEVDLHATDNNGNSAVHLVCGAWNKESIVSYFRCLELLAGYVGVGFDTVTNAGKTPLDLLSMHFNHGALKLFGNLAFETSDARWLIKTIDLLLQKNKSNEKANKLHLSHTLLDMIAPLEDDLMQAHIYTAPLDSNTKYLKRERNLSIIEELFPHIFEGIKLFPDDIRRPLLKNRILLHYWLGVTKKRGLSALSISHKPQRFCGNVTEEDFQWFIAHVDDRNLKTQAKANLKELQKKNKQRLLSDSPKDSGERTSSSASNLGTSKISTIETPDRPQARETSKDIIDESKRIRSEEQPISAAENLQTLHSIVTTDPQ